MVTRHSYEVGVQPHVLSSRLDPALYAALLDEAKANGLTVNAMLNQILRERYGKGNAARDEHQDAIDKLGGKDR